jgi:translation factor GUF1, mitochondrial
MAAVFGISPPSVLPISAKTGKGVPAVLEAVIKDFPPPTGRTDAKFRGLVIDSEFDKFRGVVSLVAVREGTLSRGEA